MTETLQLIDGFDDYATSADLNAGGWTGTSSLESTLVNVAGKALSPGTTGTTHTLTASDYIHCLFSWLTTASGAYSIVELREGTQVHGRLAYNGNGTFTFSRAGTTVGSTPTSANLGIISNTYYHIEICYRCHDTAGLYEVYINGVLACSGGAQNLDTRNAGTAGTIDTIAFLQSSGQSRIDDVAIYTGSGGGAGGTQAQKGGTRVVTKLPTADGTNVAWTASAGSDYQCVDEASPNGDTDYISTATVNDIDTFTYPALGITGTVLGVAPVSVARKDDAGARSIREVVRVAGADTPGAADMTLTSSYVAYQQIWETKPAGGAWSVADVDGAEFGVKITA